MTGLALLLKILIDANMATPAIIQMINLVKGGREAGKTDEEIQAEAMKIAMETRTITEQDMSDG
jgi:hypothetical protein